jgi:hypothetical protein
VKRELALQFCLPAGSPLLKLYRIEGQGISVRRFEFLQPIAVLAAARYCGAATTYSLSGPSGIIVGRDLVHRSKTTLRF